MSDSTNISSDLIWEVTRSYNSYLVKRNPVTKQPFSRDPFNLTNKHSKTHAGFANDKAVSVQANEKGGVSLSTKSAGKSHKPVSHSNEHAYSKGRSNQKIYKNVANSVGKSGYRGDLNKAAIARASALKKSQVPKKDTPASKPRGAKATAASTSS